MGLITPGLARCLARGRCSWHSPFGASSLGGILALCRSAPGPSERCREIGRAGARRHAGGRARGRCALGADGRDRGGAAEQSAWPRWALADFDRTRRASFFALGSLAPVNDPLRLPGREAMAQAGTGRLPCGEVQSSKAHPCGSVSVVRSTSGRAFWPAHLQTTRC